MSLVMETIPVKIYPSPLVSKTENTLATSADKGDITQLERLEKQKEEGGNTWIISSTKLGPP